MPSQQTTLQRFLTTEFITKKRLNIPAVWLKPAGAEPSPDDAVANALSTDLAMWDDQNLGVRLVDGHFELKITAPDDVWVKCLFEAFEHLRVDGRAAYGPHHVSSILLRADDDIDLWRHRWPAGHPDKAGHKVKTRIVYSEAATARSKPIWRHSSPLPGSLIGGLDVFWRPKGKPPSDLAELGLEDLELREIAATSMESICRAIAFATLLYWIRIALDGLEDWDTSLTLTIGGWIARIVGEGRDINARGKSLEGVCWSPIYDATTAVTLLEFLQKRAHASNMLGVAYLHAEGQLDRNPAAHVPGWSALERALGVQAKIGIRRAFRAGLDIDLVEAMAERYVLDESEHTYLDRESLLQDVHYEHGHDDLARKWENEPIFVGPKSTRVNPFKLYAASQLRVDVKRREFFPGHEPGAILRFSPVHGVVDGDDRYSDEYRTLNVFPGFKIKPIATPEPEVMRRAVTMIDRMLALLTRDNDEQIKWLKQFVAWIAKEPAVKPPACPLVIGGQGIGKSLFGDTLMRALFGGMAGTADAGSLSDNKFLITPFIGKLITFIDEVRIESTGAINTIKKLIRADYVSGQVKFGHQRDYYIPSRLLIASNQTDIGLTPADAADRAFFFIISWTAANKQMTDREFLEWSLSLKPFYADFVQDLAKVEVRQHLMRYFTDFPVTRAELEDLKFSSRDDESVIKSTMSKAREMARAIVADARIVWNLDITAWFSIMHLRDAIKRQEGGRTAKMDASDVLTEFERAGVLIKARRDMYMFKHAYGKLLKKMGEAHNMEIIPHHDFKPGDFDDNEVNSTQGAPPWRGNNSKEQRQRSDPRNYDPDYMGPE